MIPQGPLIFGSDTYQSLVVQDFQISPPTQITLDTNSPTLSQDTANVLSTYGLAYVPSASERKITFTNLTPTTLNLYIQKGMPVPGYPTLISVLSPVSQSGASYDFSVPITNNWNANFNVWTLPPPKLYTPQWNGQSLAEFGFNQTWPSPTIKRDTFDISNVPPGIPSSVANGPRNAAVAYSFATINNTGTNYSVQTNLNTSTTGSGTGLKLNITSVNGSGNITGYTISDFGIGYQIGDQFTVLAGDNNSLFTIEHTEQQSYGYNVGITIIPPTPPTGPSYPPLQTAPYWPPVTVTSNNLDGASADSIGYPNDTALPKQQTTYSSGDYTVLFTLPLPEEIA